VDCFYFFSAHFHIITRTPGVIMDKLDRRQFMKKAAIAGGVAIGSSMLPDVAFAAGGHEKADFGKNFAVLYDSTKCIGCRLCEMACNKTNNLTAPEIDFRDLRVLGRIRRTDRTTHTVINQYFPYDRDARMKDKPVFIKKQCMHCNEPACVSACIVNALIKTPEGPVKYDASRCIGCRYCLIACPFQIPVYEYDKPLLPLVMKCSLCAHRIPDKLPACVDVCPQEAMIFGRREDILVLAHELIRRKSEIYAPEIYGEFTAGGTSWLYLLPVSYKKVGLPDYGDDPAPKLSETIQHNVFKYFVPPVALYIILGLIMYRSNYMAQKTEEKRKGG